MDYIIILIGLSILGLLFFIVNNKRFDNNSVNKNSDLLFEELNSQVSQLEKEIIIKEAEVQNLNKNLAVANTKIEILRIRFGHVLSRGLAVKTRCCTGQSEKKDATPILGMWGKMDPPDPKKLKCRKSAPVTPFLAGDP